jgi:hypothetical protein
MRTDDDRSAGTSDLIPLGLLLVVWLTMPLWAPSNVLGSDILRFTEIAHANGRAYVDFPVEYAPLETLIVLVVARGSVLETAVLVAVLNAVATLGCWWALRQTWSIAAARYFLWFVLPLQLFMPVRLDMVSVALAVAAVSVSRRGSEVRAGSLMGASILFKLWPVVLLPLFLITRKMRALTTAGLVLLGGLLLWVALTSPVAVGQVASFRGATGWHVESVFGIATNALTDAQPRIEAGASRIGVMKPWEVGLTRFAEILLIAAVWLRASRATCDPAGGPAVAAVCSLLVLSPVASPQYVAWVLPWAAIFAVERGRLDVPLLATSASLFASSVFVVYWHLHDLYLLQVLALGRVICLVGLGTIAFTTTRRPSVTEVPQGAA